MSAITFDDFIMNNQEENPEPMENNAILVPHSLPTAVIPPKEVAVRQKPPPLLTGAKNSNLQVGGHHFTPSTLEELH